MRKKLFLGLLLFLVFAPITVHVFFPKSALAGGGWAEIGTNLLGVRLGRSVAVSPSDTYVITYQASTNSYELKASGGGGGGTFGSPVSVNSANADGTAVTYARSDHVHTIVAGLITNAMVNAAAGIVYSKLVLTASIVVADHAASALTGTGTKLVTDTGPTVNSPTIADYVTFSDAGGDPASAGRLGRNGSSLKFHDGTAARTIETQNNKAAASGYASLDSGTKVPSAQISEVLASSDLTDFSAAKTGTGTGAVSNVGPTIGTPTISDYVTLADQGGAAGAAGRLQRNGANLSWGSSGTARNVILDNDSRLTDSRAPNGSATGDLAGSYPSPTVAQSSTAFALNGVITPTQIAANTNDYAPTSLSTSSQLRLSTDASRNLTGLTGGAAGRIITILNVGSFDLVLTDADANSTAANRFTFGANITLSANQALVLQYDGTSSRWRQIGASRANSGFSTTTASFTIPGQGSTVSVSVALGAGFNTNSGVQISDGTRTMNGHVTAGGATATLTVQNDGLTNGSVGNTMSSGANIVSCAHVTASSQANNSLFKSNGSIGSWGLLTSFFTAGTGITITGTNPLTITNAGVTSNVAGNRISVSSAAGDVTVSHSSLYATPNVIINGDSQIWLYGTTNSGSVSQSLSGLADTYFADRWIGNTGTSGAATVAQTAFTIGQTSVPNEPRFYTDWNQTAGGTGTIQLAQKILGVNTFAGQTATVSVYLALSSGSISITPQITQNFGSTGSPSTAVVTTNGAWTVNSSTFTRFTSTFTVPSITGKTLGTTANTSFLELQLLFPASTTFHAQIADVQFELGSAATSYQRRGYFAELLDCQQFHWRGYSTSTFGAYGNGYAASATGANLLISFPRVMRAVPTMSSSTVSSTLATQSGVGGIQALTALGLSFSTTIGVTITTTVASGQTTGHAVQLVDNNVNTSYLDFKAEL